MRYPARRGDYRETFSFPLSRIEADMLEHIRCTGRIKPSRHMLLLVVSLVKKGYLELNLIDGTMRAI
jgi:hypothetical protein